MLRLYITRKKNFSRLKQYNMPPLRKLVILHRISLFPLIYILFFFSALLPPPPLLEIVTVPPPTRTSIAFLPNSFVKFEFERKKKKRKERGKERRKEGDSF